MSARVHSNAGQPFQTQVFPDEENQQSVNECALTSAHSPKCCSRWMALASSRPGPTPEGRTRYTSPLQVLAAAAAAALRPPRCLVYPSLGPRFHCHSPLLRCRPPVSEQTSLISFAWMDY